jgi:hypothetical protein
MEIIDRLPDRTTARSQRLKGPKIETKFLSRAPAEQYIGTLYERLLGRTPNKVEFDHWVHRALTELSPHDLLICFINLSNSLAKTTSILSSQMVIIIHQ